MKVLVLGGSYFIGRAIVEAIVADGAEVTTLNRGTAPLSLPKVRELRADRSDARALREAITERYDAVVDVSAFNAGDIERIAAVLPAPPAKYVMISSASIYDRSKTPPPFVENGGSGGDAIWGEYGVDKWKAEQALERSVAAAIYLVRPPYVYGPRNYEDRERFIWARLLENKPIFVPQRGLTRIQFSYAETIGAFVASILSGDDIAPGAYNIGEAASYSFLDWINLAGEICGQQPDLRFVNDESIRVRDYFPFRDHELTLDVSKVRTASDIVDPALADGLEKSYGWARSAEVLAYKPTPQEQKWIAESAK